MDIPLHILLNNPIADVAYGIQRGTGSDYTTIQTRQSAGEDLPFSLTIQLREDPKKENVPRFMGPFVQGKPLDQFIYIDVGKYAGQATDWGGRIKVPLTGITREAIARLNKQSGAVLATNIPGTKDGKPVFATVKNFEGWKIKSK